ncbi:helix-turn-helix domain containing protein [Nocardia higoensis]|uniref:Helix-turn-helix domain containing protein n=1 Tax=Nocardia higoensis TaxID=228599 RepID=A0ABS0DGT8_9NOCA|nr:helix-turn-helix domain-containing protein [Nocardia higoensis]MBF6357687.1 helix-turn-helix domain containing protein [Nocardia higoensis]
MSVPARGEPLELTESERRTLQGWLRRRNIGAAAVLRARIVLECAAGGSNTEVGRRVGVSRETVRKWRVRFARDRIAGLADEPRPGAPRTITDEQVDKLIVATLETAPPHGDTHWSSRSISDATGMSQSTVSRIWRAFGLKPHVVQTSKLSTDPSQN